MDRDLQSVPSPYGPPGGTPAPPARGGHAPAPGLPPKTTADYLQALRRRLALVLMIAVLAIVPGSIWVARRPNVYRAQASLRIEPPSFDERVATIVPHSGVGATSHESQERYVPDRLAELRGRALAEKAAANPELHLPADAIEEVAQLLVASLTSRRQADSNTFEIFFEWTDRERVALLLNSLLKEFADAALTESDKNLEISQRLANDNIREIVRSLEDRNRKIEMAMRQTPIFTPDGKNALQEQLVQYNSILMQKRVRTDEIIQQQRLLQFTPHARTPAADPNQARINLLLEQKERYLDQLEAQRRIVKKFNTDPASKHYAWLLQKTLDELDRLQAASPEEAEPDLLAMFLTHQNDDVQRLEREVKSLQEQIQASMPSYENFLSLLRDRERLQKNLDAMQERLAEFEFLAKTRNHPITILQAATEPSVPVKPNRALYEVAVILLGLGLGAGTVCLLESCDRRVKVPEHLAAGLTMPLLGVVPRLRRLARLHRGGHVCAYRDPAVPESDAFRNLRASLLGVVSPKGRPLVSLLVTSAKPGEGKTTTALNLAATCARSGERTLLMEVDLRRPSLAPVFDPGHDFGLVDALRGDLPWQRTVVRTDVPNLDYMPCGDPGGVPVEALGTLEMRQLLAAVSTHYHRVILDGPAILGLADGRMLGRLVDAAILVVRCGAHDLSPLQRAKGMLELSKVPLVGAVFNALDEDLHNWSSYADVEALSAPARPAARSLPRADVAAEPVGAAHG